MDHLTKKSQVIHNLRENFIQIKNFTELPDFDLIKKTAFFCIFIKHKFLGNKRWLFGTYNNFLFR